MAKKILMVIAFKDFRDPEYFIPKQIFEQAGFSIKTASNKAGIAIGAEGGEVEVDTLVSQINLSDFDAVIFIGGPGCLTSLDNEISYKLLKDTVAQERLLASICISPIILAKAGVLKNKKATVWTSPMDKNAVKILQEHKANYVPEQVVSDGNIITSSGPESAHEFGQEIVKYLTK
jgi:protease I